MVPHKITWRRHHDAVYWLNLKIAPVILADDVERHHTGLVGPNFDFAAAAVAIAAVAAAAAAAALWK